VNFCHQSEDAVLKRAELHMKTKKQLNRNQNMEAMIEIETDDNEHSTMMIRVKKKKRKWSSYDISSLLIDVANKNWTIKIKFQDMKTESNNATGLQREIYPGQVISMANSPFIVLFLNDNENYLKPEIKQSKTLHKRQKRYVELYAEVFNHLNLSNIGINLHDTNNNQKFPLHQGLNESNKGNTVSKEGETKSDYDEEEEEEELVLDYEMDDMSDVEAKRYRFSVTKAKSVLPYPKWMKRKKQRTSKHKPKNTKQKKRKRKRNRDNESDRKKYLSKSKSLPKIWKSFGKQIDPGQSLDKNLETICSLQPLEVNLKEIGWGSTVISPVKYQANYCSGSCSFPMSQAENPSNHATVLSILARKQLGETNIPEACCVPRKMDSLTLLYFDVDGSVVLKTYPQMAVKSCGCR